MHAADNDPVHSIAIEQLDDQAILVSRLVARIAELEQLLYAQHLDKDVDECPCGVHCECNGFEDHKSSQMQQLFALPAIWGNADNFDLFRRGRCATSELFSLTGQYLITRAEVVKGSVQGTVGRYSR